MELDYAFRLKTIRALPVGAELILIENESDPLDQFRQTGGYGLHLGSKVFKVHGYYLDKVLVRTEDGLQCKIPFKYLSTQSIEVAKKLINDPKSV